MKSKKPADAESRNMEVGKRVKEKRLLWGLSQEKLSEQIGVTTNYLGEIERGHRTLSLNVADKLCRRFGITYDYLYLGIEWHDSQRMGEDSTYLNNSKSQVIALLQHASEKECALCLNIIQSVLEELRTEISPQ